MFFFFQSPIWRPVAGAPPPQISGISDEWDGSLISLVVKHLVPGFWDIWHQLGSPPAEKQPYAVLLKGRGYELREYVPRLSYQPSMVDRTQEREVRV